MAQADKKKPGKLLVVSGPSGSGKSTLCRLAVQKTAAQLSISATTRPRSDQEVHNQDYFFLTEVEFQQRIDADQFLEFANVFGNYYGTPIEPVEKCLEQGLTVILEIDVQGATQVFSKNAQAIGILILPPSDEELKRRLCNRKRDSQETIEKRLAEAKNEIEIARQSGRFKHTIVNDNLEEALQKLVDIINQGQPQ
ncbi:MAG: guanylate kinase [Sedimentisphaerales bacterium]|nr:guanylate kinase [Sedimentisphaerales bacterium]